ncbi:hypothetical protein L580_3032 [Serratia fonticola AU-P3(3)]|nr:hypothetical protein L580_3032 [Serratia fonticola AU-P3(3)]
MSSSQQTANSHAEARFLAKRNRCIDIEMDAKADMQKFQSKKLC